MTRPEALGVPPATCAALWGGLNSALVLSCLRAHGSAGAEGVERETGARLVDALTTGQGWAAAVPGPEACARLQMASDQRKGRAVHGGESGGAFWLAYTAMHWLSHAPQVGVTMPAVVSAGLQSAYYESRHGEVARRMGGRFVLVHSLAQGDPFDAGYFVRGDAAADNPHRPEWLHDMSSLLDSPATPESVMTGRSTGTLVHEAGLRMHVLCERYGVPGGALLVEHALRILLTGYRGWLPEALGVPQVSTPRDAAALYARFWETTGVQVESGEGERPRVSVRLEDVWPDAGTFPWAIAEAIARAWSMSLAHLDFNLRCWIVNPQQGDSGHFAVEFDAGGPDSFTRAPIPTFPQRGKERLTPVRRAG